MPTISAAAAASFPRRSFESIESLAGAPPRVEPDTGHLGRSRRAGGNEIAGGVSVLLVSWAALKTGTLPRGLNYLGLAAGAAGLLTVVPALEAVGAVFGIGLIVWFVWLGVILLRPDDGSSDHGRVEG